MLVAVSVDEDGIDDPFASDSDSPPKRPAAAAATKAKSSALSESGDSDGYSDDEFAADNKATAAATAPASASKLASMFASKASVSSSSSKPAAAPVERGRARSRSASRSRNQSRSASRSPSPFSSREPRSRGRQRSRSRTPPRDRSRSGSPRSRSRSPRASAPSGGMSRLKALLTKKRDDDGDGGGAGGRKVPQGKSFMDEQKEKLAANPHYVQKQKQLTLKKLALAGFMSAAKKTDYSKQVSGLLADIKNCTFKPQLSAGTRDLLEKGGHVAEFSERLKGYIQAKKDKLKSQSRLGDNFTFKPHLNHERDEQEEAKDADARRKEFEEHVAADLRRRKEELAAKQRRLDPQCTFSPQLSTPPKNARRSEKLRQPFLQRYHKDLDKRDAGIEAKIAAAKVGTHPFAPQITATAMAVGKARGGFLERTIRDVELRNKKMRYRAKLLDLEPPVHGRISVPEPEQDPFLRAQQRREMSRSASARHSLAHTRSHSAQGSDDDENGGGREDGRRSAHGRARNTRDRLDESDGAGKWATSTGHMRGLNGSASLSRVRPATATAITTSAVAPAILGGTIPRAPARPSIGSSVEPPRRGRRMSASEKKRYELELRARKRAEAAARAAGRNGADGGSGRSQSRGANSSDAGSRRASIDRSGGSSHRSQHKPAARSPPRSRSRSRSRSHSRSRSRTPSPRRSRTPSPVSRRHTRRHSRGRSRSRSPSSATGGRSRSSSPFADPHSLKKRQRHAQPQGASHARRRSRSRSPSPFASSRSPSPLRSRSSSRSPPPAKGRRRS